LAKNLSPDITLKELYEYSKIDLYLYSANLNCFCKVRFHHSTHPDLKVYEAIHMSSCVPILFKPMFYKEAYYIDGGLFMNCPINDCYQNENCNKDEILVLMYDKKKTINKFNPYYIENNYDFNDYSKNELNTETNLMSFLIYIIKTMINKIHVIENEHMINMPNIINICLTPITVDLKYWNYVLNNTKEREYLIELGLKQATIYIDERKEKEKEEKEKEEKEKEEKEKEEKEEKEKEEKEKEEKEEKEKEEKEEKEKEEKEKEEKENDIKE
jgi:hypothetical protein